MYNYFKRLADFLVAFLMLLLLAPIFLIITLCQLISLRGNPFFTQQRPGKHEKIFSVIKFKSMSDEKDSNGELLPDDKRITKFGSFLRKSSLDEIPQLINVVKGDMSFIGPRPLLIRYLPFYNETEKRRHSVKPGITGLAQISGRNYISWEKKFELDVHYVEHMSLKLDLNIFFQTISKVLKSSDVAVATNTVTEYFDVYRQKNLEEI